MLSSKYDGVYQEIKTQILQSSVVGSDETGEKVNGTKRWIWTVRVAAVCQNLQNTFIIASSNRGYKTVDSVFENRLPNSLTVSDSCAAHLKPIQKIVKFV